MLKINFTSETTRSDSEKVFRLLYKVNIATKILSSKINASNT